MFVEFVMGVSRFVQQEPAHMWGKVGVLPNILANSPSRSNRSSPFNAQHSTLNVPRAGPGLGTLLRFPELTTS